VTDAELDRQLAALGGVEPPPELQRRILSEVGVPAERVAALVEAPRLLSLPRPAVAPPRLARRWRPFVLIGGLALAAASLLVVRAPTPVADPAALVPRGSTDIAATLALRVAVRQGDRVERLAVGQPYRAGDTLLFRVSSPGPADIELRRGDIVLYRGAIPAGDTDLPVGYTLEAGEGPARFVVAVSGAEAAVDLPGVLP
jgi:hypothetical protein